MYCQQCIKCPERTLIRSDNFWNKFPKYGMLCQKKIIKNNNNQCFCPIRSPISISVFMQRDCLPTGWRRATASTSSYSPSHQHFYDHLSLHHQPQSVRTPQIRSSRHILLLESKCHKSCWCVKHRTQHQIGALTVPHLQLPF